MDYSNNFHKCFIRFKQCKRKLYNGGHEEEEEMLERWLMHQGKKCSFPGNG